MSYLPTKEPRIPKNPITMNDVRSVFQPKIPFIPWFKAPVVPPVSPTEPSASPRSTFVRYMWKPSFKNQILRYDVPLPDPLPHEIPFNSSFDQPFDLSVPGRNTDSPDTKHIVLPVCPLKEISSPPKPIHPSSETQMTEPISQAQFPPHVSKPRKVFPSSDAYLKELKEVTNVYKSFDPIDRNILPSKVKRFVELGNCDKIARTPQAPKRKNRIRFDTPRPSTDTNPPQTPQVSTPSIKKRKRVIYVVYIFVQESNRCITKRCRTKRQVNKHVKEWHRLYRELYPSLERSKEDVLNGYTRYCCHVYDWLCRKREILRIDVDKCVKILEK